MNNVLVSQQSQIKNIEDSIGINGNKIAIGTSAGDSNQGANAVAIGTNAGDSNQGANAVAIGTSAGATSQKVNSISIGNKAGNGDQGENCISLGYESGTITQGNKSIAIGYYSGRSNQKANSIAIGNGAGVDTQLQYSIALGDNAGALNQNTYAIAIGNRAGNNNQGDYSIAIGNNAGFENQHANSIVLNASEDQLDASANSGFFVNPITFDASYNGNFSLYYNNTTKEIKYSPVKTFVIPHPSDNNKYLVHGCLEGPEAGVYYRGKGTIINNESVKIELPEYVKYIGTNYSINITKIFSGKKTNEQYETSEIENNSFTVYGSNGSFYWIVFAEREKIEVEPEIKDIKLEGDGPYKYINKN